MRVALPPLNTVRTAVPAALAALAVAAPVTFLLQRSLDRDVSTAGSNSAPAATAGAAKPVAGTGAGSAKAPAARPARPALPGPGLPGSLAVALEASRIVVVGLYVAGDPVDMSVVAEAQAGAALAEVPYVPVNVGDESQIGDLASRLPSLSVPAVLLVGPGGRILQQLSGYVDRSAVAGAVDSARPR